MNPFRSDLQAAHDRIRVLEQENDRLRVKPTKRTVNTVTKSFFKSFVRLLSKRMGIVFWVTVWSIGFIIASCFFIFCLMHFTQGPCSEKDMVCNTVRSWPSWVRWVGVLLPFEIAFPVLLGATWLDARSKQ